MEVQAHITNLRLAPRKVRAVVNMVKNRTVDSALDQLEHMSRRPATPLIKLIKSAIANAENTHHMIRDNLYIKSFVVDEGMKLKRYMPRALGRTVEIQRKACHIHLVLDEKVPGLKRSVKKEKAEKKDVAVKETVTESAKEFRADVKPEIKREAGRKSGGIFRRLFQRKAV